MEITPLINIFTAGIFFQYEALRAKLGLGRAKDENSKMVCIFIMDWNIILLLRDTSGGKGDIRSVAREGRLQLSCQTHTFRPVF